MSPIGNENLRMVVYSESGDSSKKLLHNITLQNETYPDIRTQILDSEKAICDDEM
jgi:hypothetical protein